MNQLTRAQLDALQSAARYDAAPSVDVRPPLLVVDDEEVLRHALRSYFSLDGYRVDTAASVAAALALIAERSRDGRAPYAAVVSDLRLSESDEEGGIALLRHVRERWPALPFVLLTGYPSAAAAACAERSGASAIVVKPRPLVEIARIVRSLVARGHPDRG